MDKMELWEQLTEENKDKVELWEQLTEENKDKVKELWQSNNSKSYYGNSIESYLEEMVSNAAASVCMDLEKYIEKIGVNKYVELWYDK